MLKRQRPATPPPASLGDLPTFFPNGSVRPSQPLDTSQPRTKRQRVQPPPLDGALRGWPVLESPGQHWESDDEEDWIEDPRTELGSQSQTSTTSQYKDANSLLHELHVLNQHRLSFAHWPPDPSARTYTHAQDPVVEHRPASWTDGSSYHPALSQSTCDGLAGRISGIESADEKGFVEEVQFVRQHYEDTNRLLGSLFLLRRREVKGMTSSPGLGPSR